MLKITSGAIRYKYEAIMRYNTQKSINSLYHMINLHGTQTEVWKEGYSKPKSVLIDTHPSIRVHLHYVLTNF